MCSTVLVTDGSTLSVEKVLVRCQITVAPKVQVRQLTENQCKSCFFCELFQKKPNCLGGHPVSLHHALKPSQV